MGMPSISDPGVELVQQLFPKYSSCSITRSKCCFNSSNCFWTYSQPFTFYGFLSRKKSELTEELKSLKDKSETLMFYESPHRLTSFLKELVTVFGEGRQVVLARELTKRYEEFIRGTAKEVYDWAKETELRGEFVVLVAGNDEVEEEVYWEDWTVLEHIEYKITYEKMSSKDAIKAVAKERNVPKREVYAEYHQ